MMNPLLALRRLSRTLAIPAAIFAMSIALSVQPARAIPTQEEVFRSINQNVDAPVDFSRIIPFLLAAGGVIILVVLYNHRMQNVARPKVLHHPRKLERELSRKLNLRPVDLKQLRLLADEQSVEFPLLLLLCPSTLGKAMKTTNPQVDRKVLRELVARLREDPKREDAKTAQR